jgi:predicted nucleic acid-binding protein
VKYFLDTNILLYADDGNAGPRHEMSVNLIEEAMTSGHGVTSTQVLQEYFVNATRKLGIEAGEAKLNVELYSRMGVVQVRLADILAAIDLHRIYQLPLWDALIVSCAAAFGCDRVLTEDLQHGQVIAGVKIENPFLTLK